MSKWDMKLFHRLLNVIALNELAKSGASEI
jgi:hypothetical protein